MSTRHAMLLIAGALAVGGSAEAMTPANGVPVSIVVSTRDLNLQTSAGTRVLYDRLKHAARRACGEPDSRELERAARARQCTREALNDAVERVQLPRLTALHQRGSSAAAG